MTPIYSSDKELIKQLKKGDEAAYLYLVDNHHHRLCVFAYSLIHDRFKAEDIVQNVFLIIWQKRNKLKDDFDIKGFLSRSVYNEFIDQYRKHQSVIALEKKYIEALDFIFEEKKMEGHTKLITAVQKEIQNLPPRCREVFVLSKQEGLTNIEISEYLRISIKTVEAQITKAFSILRAKLGDKMVAILFLIFGYDKKTLST